MSNINNESVNTCFLSAADREGHHDLYNMGVPNGLPVRFREKIQKRLVQKMISQEDIVVLNDIPLRYAVGEAFNPFAEKVVNNDYSSQMTVPLGCAGRKNFFLILLKKESGFNSSLYDYLYESKEEIKQKIVTYFNAFERITHFFKSFQKILQLKGDETFPHMNRVGQLSFMIANEVWKIAHRLNYQKILKAFSGLSLETLRLAATIHDIGKVAIPDKILHKPGKLTKEEFEIIKSHSAKGVEILETAFPDDYCYLTEQEEQKELSEIIRISKDIVLKHHERSDGTGYPNRLKGDQIGLFSKIVSIADVFDAITSRRIYKEKESIDYAVEEITEMNAGQFDPLVIEALLRVIKHSDQQAIRE